MVAEQLDFRQDMSYLTILIFTVHLCFSAPTLADVVEIDHFDHSRGQIELMLPDGSSEMIDLAGQSTMQVYFEGTTEGSAFDNDGDSLDEVQTEIVALDLAGTASVGLVHMRLRPSLSANGQMEETVNNTPDTLDVPPFATSGTVDSFFDVYVELEIPAFGTLHTEQPVRWVSQISHKPPGPTDIYESLEPIDLFDAAGNFTGLYLGATHYQPNPCVKCSDVDESGTTDMPDLETFVNNWLWTESIGDTYNASDLNCDWVVNFFDFEVFACNWLQTCP